MQPAEKTLGSGFLHSAAAFPDRPALEVDGCTLSYADLRLRAAQLASTLHAAAPNCDPPLTAVYAQRSASTYAGILAALLRGHGYVPLNPGFPPLRTRRMLERSECQTLIVDRVGAERLAGVLDSIGRRLVVLLADNADPAPFAERWPQHRWLGQQDISSEREFEPVQADSDAIAYLMFTSGSTGVPKGVTVAHRNVVHFLDTVVERYEIRESDRFSQLFETTFDLSVFDLFAAWEKGACVCCPTHSQRMFLAQYIHQSKVAIWFSVPSTGAIMKRLNMLPPNQFPNVRLSLFCGEALSADLAVVWAQAASKSILENLYGPTELTIACTFYRWDRHRSASDCENGLVAIGDPLPGMEALVVDDALVEVDPGELGELLMTGPQLTLGYWQDPEKTRAAFVCPPGRHRNYYRTGDRVRRPVANGRPLTYLGRLDDQVKVQGYRVELQEIEAVLREVAEVTIAVALGWPKTPSGAAGIAAFLGAEAGDLNDIRRRAAEHLPAYMVPNNLRKVARFPLNFNGKIDREALLLQLEEEPNL